MATITEQKAETEAALAKLHAAVENIADSKEWAEWLAFLSKLHSYSSQNIMWMWCQWESRRMAQAVWNIATGGLIPPLPRFSQPAAFSFWKDHGRMVTKGEKALTVLAPIIIKDSETGKDKCVGFRLKSRTFDVAQTHGAPVPENPAHNACNLLTGEGDPETFAKVAAIAEANGWTVSDDMPAHLPAEANGVCMFGDKVLAVRAGLAGEQRLKTLVHELAHSLMHSPDEYVRAHSGGVEAMEIEAESVAYVVADRLGFDSSAYSIGYVASWASGNGAKVAKSAERVLDTAGRILAALETGTLPPAKGAKPAKVDA